MAAKRSVLDYRPHTFIAVALCSFCVSRQMGAETTWRHIERQEKPHPGSETKLCPRQEKGEGSSKIFGMIPSCPSQICTR